MMAGSGPTTPPSLPTRSRAHRNLYVPGIDGNGSSTTARIISGYATDAADNLITEFLPDVARHVHVRVIFGQRILNQVSSDQNALQ